MGTRGYASTVIITGIVLTPLVAIIKDGWPLGVILLWITCIYLATKSYSMVENSVMGLNRRYADKPGDYYLPKFAIRYGIPNYIPKKGMEIPLVYQNDRFVFLGIQQVIVYRKLKEGLKIDRELVKIMLESFLFGAYKVDNFGIYRSVSSSVGEVENRGDQKRIYIATIDKIEGKLSVVCDPSWAGGNVIAEFSKFTNYYDEYEYDYETKKCRLVENEFRTDKNVNCTEWAKTCYLSKSREMRWE